MDIKCYEEKIKPQVKEILTNYGDLCLIWFDNPIEIEEKYSQELYNMIKTSRTDMPRKHHWKDYLFLNEPGKGGK